MCYVVASLLKKIRNYARYHGINEDNINDLERQLAAFDPAPFYQVDGFSKDRPRLLVITNDKPREFQFFSWRLLTDEIIKKRFNTLNAKKENMYNYMSNYRESAISRHCLVIVDGFFEPHGYGKTVKKRKNKKMVNDHEKKAYYYITTRNDDPMTMAGIWNYHVDESTGEETGTLSIVTVPASPLLEKIHNVMKRMPAILPKELHNDWLNCVSGNYDKLMKERAMEILQPYDDELLKYWPVYNIKKRDAFGNSPQTLEFYDYSDDPDFNGPVMEEMR